LNKLLLVLCALLMSVTTAWAAVNANTASVDELQTVTGIGPTIAQRIVDERKKGPFKDLADLEQRVKGVGESSIRKMAAGGLTVGGSSRAKPKDDSADAKKPAKDGAKPAEKGAAPTTGQGTAQGTAQATGKPAAANPPAKGSEPAATTASGTATATPAAAGASAPPAAKPATK
jgi:competence protein ComEA